MPDRSETTAARDASIELVSEHRTSMIAGATAVRNLAERRDEFSSLDVRRMMETMGFDPSGEPRVLGAIMLSAARRGIIERTDRTTTSDSAKAHNRPVRVWRSLLRPDAPPKDTLGEFATADEAMEALRARGCWPAIAYRGMRRGARVYRAQVNVGGSSFGEGVTPVTAFRVAIAAWRSVNEPLDGRAVDPENEA